MDDESRNNYRYPEIGRIVAPTICAINGILDNISMRGCKIHFPCVFTMDLDKEHEINVHLSRSSKDLPLRLLCKPIWIEHGPTDTYIGMQYLYSPDEARLRDFIDFLDNVSVEDLPDIV